MLETYAPRQGDDITPQPMRFRSALLYLLVVVVLASIVFMFAWSASANAAGGCGGG